MKLFKKDVPPNCSTCEWLATNDRVCNYALGLDPKCTAQGYAYASNVYATKRCIQVYRTKVNEKGITNDR